MSDADLPAVRRALHDVAFSVLRSGTREPWSIQQNEANVRSVVSASLQGEEVPGSIPEFASRLVLPGRGSVRPRVKLIMQTESKYAQYMELLDIVDSVKSREERCAKFRANLRKHISDLDQSISDKIFTLELEELKLKRDIRNIVRGEDPEGSVRLESEDERLALFAATSLQPALQEILRAALKGTGAEPAPPAAAEPTAPAVKDEGGDDEPAEGEGEGHGAFLHRDESMDRLAKKLERATRGGLREAAAVQEGATALRDRGHALVTLLENLREEVQAAAHDRDFSALHRRLQRKTAALERLRRLSRNGRDADAPAAVLAAAVRRRFVLRDAQEEERAAAARVLQAGERRRVQASVVGPAREIAAQMWRALATGRLKRMREAAVLLSAALRRGVLHEAEADAEVTGEVDGEATAAEQ